MNKQELETYLSMNKQELETYLKVQDEAWNRAKKIFDEKIRVSGKQDFDGVEIGDDIFTIQWSESCYGEWDDYYEHFPTELLLLDEDECMKKIDEILIERARKRKAEKEKNDRIHEKIMKDEELATMRTIAAKYGYFIGEKENG